MTDATSPVSSRAIPEGGVVLSGRVLARIGGPGADKFVQGQFSQHVDDITETQSRRAAACTPKGRAYCLTRFARVDGDLVLELDEALADAALTQLNKYLMLFRGTTMTRLEQAQVVGLMGEDAARSVAGSAADELTTTGQVLALPGGILIRLEPTADEQPRYQWWQLNDPQPLPADLPAITEQDWALSEIAAGVPNLTPETVEAYVPQMLNLQHLQGVHFKKGCYTGQEVIARMHFLGQLKKSLFRLAFTGAQPAPGTRILAGDKTVGEVVNAALSDSDGGQCLAVLRHDSATATLALETAPDTVLTVLPMPYAVPEQTREDSADT
ncbi:MAG: folate-binding protein [Pseudomonadota bacterium]|nr:folate-binding protein [Pseudomonadota bacterium]